MLGSKAHTTCIETILGMARHLSLVLGEQFATAHGPHTQLYYICSMLASQFLWLSVEEAIQPLRISAGHQVRKATFLEQASKGAVRHPECGMQVQGWHFLLSCNLKWHFHVVDASLCCLMGCFGASACQCPRCRLKHNCNFLCSRLAGRHVRRVLKLKHVCTPLWGRVVHSILVRHDLLHPFTS